MCYNRFGLEHATSGPHLKMVESSNYAAVFHQRAEELLAIAELVHDTRNREILLKCATDYEKMAEQYEKALAQGGEFRFPPMEFLPGFTALTPSAKPLVAEGLTAPPANRASKD